MQKPNAYSIILSYNNRYIRAGGGEDFNKKKKEKRFIIFLRFIFLIYLYIYQMCKTTCAN